MEKKIDPDGKPMAGQDGKQSGSQGDPKPGDASGGSASEGASGENGGERAVSHESFQAILKEKKAMQKKLADFEAGEKSRNDAKLIEEGKIKELLEKEKENTAKSMERVKLAELRAAALKHGMIDGDYVKVIKDDIEFDSDGIPQNTDSFFDALKAKKPFLFGQASETPPPSHHQGGGKPWTPGGTFTEKDILSMDNKEFLEKFPAIQKQMHDQKII
jgi:hypothetical protein